MNQNFAQQRYVFFYKGYFLWIFWLKDSNFEQKTAKTCFKTYFRACFIQINSVSLQALTKQHNLFYTLKKLIPINSAGLCEKSRAVVILESSVNYCTLL